jgi:hypothetical protein
MSTQQQEQESITGRDWLIIPQALNYAIKYIDSQPKILRERSNRADMARILLAMYPGYVESQRHIVDHLEQLNGLELSAAAKARLEVPDLSNNGWGADDTGA